MILLACLAHPIGEEISMSKTNLVPTTFLFKTASTQDSNKLFDEIKECINKSG